jgi:hypothetical protein
MRGRRRVSADVFSPLLWARVSPGSDGPAPARTNWPGQARHGPKISGPVKHCRPCLGRSCSPLGGTAWDVNQPGL